MQVRINAVAPMAYQVTVTPCGVAGVLAGGGRVTADGVAVPGGLFGAESSRDLLLGLRGTQVALSLVGGRGYPQVRQEAEDVGLAVAQAFQEHPAGFLLLPGAGDTADLL